MSIDESEKFIGLLPARGFSVVHYSKDGYFTAPLVGFSVHAFKRPGENSIDYFVYPVTTTEILGDEDTFAILHPNGTVEVPYEGSYKSLIHFEEQKNIKEYKDDQS